MQVPTHPPPPPNFAEFLAHRSSCKSITIQERIFFIKQTPTPILGSKSLTPDFRVMFRQTPGVQEVPVDMTCVYFRDATKLLPQPYVVNVSPILIGLDEWILLSSVSHHICCLTEFRLQNPPAWIWHVQRCFVAA